MDRGSPERPLPEAISSRILLYRRSSSAAASYMFLPGNPGSSGVSTTLFLQPIWLIAIWLIAALSENMDLPDPPQTTQLADFRSSYRGSSFFFLTPRRLCLIRLTYPTWLILSFIARTPHLASFSSSLDLRPCPHISFGQITWAFFAFLRKQP